MKKIARIIGTVRLEEGCLAEFPLGLGRRVRS
jgi:hypothetical protein